MNNFSTPYFKHDTHARNHSQLVLLQMKYGLRGLGFWWCLVEILYEQSNKVMLTECDSIAYALHEQCEWIADVMRFLASINLIQLDENGQFYYSKSVEERLSETYNTWKKKSDLARKAAYSRHKKPFLQEHSVGNADALQTQCEMMPIREDKIREDKIREREDAGNFDALFIQRGVQRFLPDFRRNVKRQKMVYNMEAYANAYIENRIARESGASTSGTTDENAVADAIAVVRAKRKSK